MRARDRRGVARRRDLGAARGRARADGRLGAADVPEGGAVPRRGGRARRRAVGRAPGARSRARARCAAGAPEVTFVADGDARGREAGRDRARDRRGQRPDDRGGLPHGRLRRRPDRGQGRDGQPLPRSPTTSARRSSASASPTTRAWRAAAASRGRSRSRSRPTRQGAATPSQILRMSYDRSIERVVVLGNGIAGVTAADHVRRRHPECDDRPRRRRAAPALQPHGHHRLIYGRSAMEGLYLQPGRVVRRNARSTRG